MALAFTVIVNVRHQFGAEDINIGVFAGGEKTWTFDCPGVSREQALLIFQSRDVDLPSHTIEINGVPVFGGLPATTPGPAAPRTGGVIGSSVSDHRHGLYEGQEQVDPFWPFGGWSGNVLLVNSGTLREHGNELHIEMARGHHFIPFDTVIVDNVVLIYKTHQSASQSGAEAAESAESS